MSELVQFAKLQKQMRRHDAELVPRFLVVAMFGLMFACVAMVAYGKIQDVPMTGVLIEAPIVQSVDVVMTGHRNGTYTVHDVDGNLLASSSDALAGFIGVIGRVIERDRFSAGITENLPVQVVRRDNGNIAIIDGSVDLTVELIGYGKDNVAAFAKLLD
jgi:putative photosynthetic complex assembly protein